MNQKTLMSEEFYEKLARSKLKKKYKNSAVLYNLAKHHLFFDVLGNVALIKAVKRHVILTDSLLKEVEIMFLSCLKECLLNTRRFKRLIVAFMLFFSYFYSCFGYFRSKIVYECRA